MKAIYSPSRCRTYTALKDPHLSKTTLLHYQTAQPIIIELEMIKAEIQSINLTGLGHLKGKTHGKTQVAYLLPTRTKSSGGGQYKLQYLNPDAYRPNKPGGARAPPPALGVGITGGTAIKVPANAVTLFIYFTNGNRSV